jgi:hypothetical protein
MRRRGIKRVIVLLSICLSLVLCIQTYTAKADTYQNNISIEGNANGLVTIPDQEWFLRKANMVPGDSAIGTIKLENKYDYAYEVFIRAEDSEKKSDSDFVDQLKLNIAFEGNNIYSGALNGEDKMAKDISLGVINPGESKIIDASVILDGASTGNAFKNKYASIDWIFTAQRVEAKETPAKTGDANNLIAIGCILVLSSGVLLLAIKKWGDKHEDK